MNSLANLIDSSVPRATALALIFALFLLGCATTIAPVINPAQVKHIAIGQARTDIEKLLGHSPETFILRAKPGVKLQAWEYLELSDIKCLMLTYDVKDVLVDFEIIVRDKGRNAMPIPGC